MHCGHLVTGPARPRPRRQCAEPLTLPRPNMRASQLRPFSLPSSTVASAWMDAFLAPFFRSITPSATPSRTSAAANNSRHRKQHVKLDTYYAGLGLARVFGCCESHLLALRLKPWHNAIRFGVTQPPTVVWLHCHTSLGWRVGTT